MTYHALGLLIYFIGHWNHTKWYLCICNKMIRTRQPINENDLRKKMLQLECSPVGGFHRLECKDTWVSFTKYVAMTIWYDHTNPTLADQISWEILVTEEKEIELVINIKQRAAYHWATTGWICHPLYRNFFTKSNISDRMTETGAWDNF